MNVKKADVAVSSYDAETCAITGDVTFFFEVPGEVEQGTAHFHCSARLDDPSSKSKIGDALMQEACRQISRMPEYILGERKLTFAEGVLH